MIRTRHIALACLWAVPLVSLTHIGGLAWAYPGLLLVLAAWTAWRPAAGLLLFALLAPLGFALVNFGSLPLSVPRVVEGALLALLSGWSLHVVWRPDHLDRSRLALPATSMALIVSASAIVAALAQFGNAGEALDRIWSQLTNGSLDAGPAKGLAASFRWIEVLALAVMAERTIRQTRSWAPIIVATWLGAGAAVAAQTVVRVAQVTLGRGEGLRGAIDLFQHTRFGAIYADTNAAGSLFALLLLAAVLFTIARRRWLFGLVTVPVLLIALLGTQSRSAVAAVIVVAAAVIVVELFRRGRRTVAIALAVIAIAGSASVIVAKGSTHVSAGVAFESRAELWRAALKISAEDPVFGVGAGQFQSASKDYLTEDFIAFFPEARHGENAHNNFLQVLAELGLTGFLAFLWLLIAAFWPTPDAVSSERWALIAGLAAFVLSAQFGHPLLIYDIAVGFFLALGLQAGLASAPASPARLWQWGLIALIAVTLPWRVWVALTPDTPDVVGASMAPAPLDGVSYYTAEGKSQWRLRAHVRNALFPMRWDGAAAANCRVQILIDDKLADEVSLRSDAWMPVPMILPPGRRESDRAEVELRVSADTCKLLVGSFRAWR